jgi:RNA polymerase sigma-70 factor (ECF subfamily)
MSERSLVARCLAGDGGAERHLYDTHIDRVYQFVYRFCGEQDAAADLAQETFILAFDRLHQFRGDAGLATWLRSIAWSVAVGSGRARGGKLRRRTVAIAEAHSIAAREERRLPDLEQQLYAAIDRLSDKLRPVFVMHDVEGYTHQEIAETLGIPVGTSKARLFDARAKLRAALADFAGDIIA